MARRPLSPALRAHLAHAGVLRERGITRTPKVRHCLSCGDRTVMFIDPVIANRVVVLDIEPTTLLGASLVTLAGLAPCYRLARTWADSWWLGLPLTPDPARARVHPPHVCGSRWPVRDDLPGLFPASSAARSDGPPPF